METQERRRPDTVVTSDNLAEYQKHKLDIAEAITPVKEPVEEVKKETKTEEPKEEEKEEQDALPLEDTDKDTEKALKSQKKANHKIEERFSKLAEERKTAVARAEAAERKAAELEARLKPVEVKEEENSKPDKDKYTDAFLYAEDLSKWAAKNAIREKEESDRKHRIENEHRVRLDTWNERIESAKKEIPDYVEKITNAGVQLGGEVREAIIDSEIGPKILLHFAENPQEAKKINEMTVGRALIALGKLEAKLTVEPKKEEEPEDKIEISKAPAPISPLKGASAPVDLPIDSKGNWTGTLDQYKEARRAGKIK